MSLEELRDRLGLLDVMAGQNLVESSYSLTPESVRIAHQHKVFSELRPILFSTGIEEVGIAKRLKDFLAEHWSLINGTVLAYTAMPEAEITLLLCEVAEFVGKTLQEPAIAVLMPSVVLSECEEDSKYPDLRSLALTEVLKTYILGNEGCQLLPVSLLLEIDVSDEKLDSIVNPYWNYVTGADDYERDAIVGPSQIARLAKHSTTTMALIDTWKRLQALQQKSSSVYEQLLRLKDALLQNSIHGMSHNTNAAGLAYPAIIAFNDYYQELEEAVKSKIPEPVQAEIKTLLMLSSDHEENEKATKNTETCIATRSSILSNLLSEHAACLKSLGVSDERIQSLVTQASKTFNQAREELKARFLAKRYAGEDNGLTVTMAVLQTLNINIRINSPRELDAFLSFSVEVLATSLKDPELCDQVSEAILSLDALVLILHDQSIEKLEILLPAINLVRLIHNPQELSAFLRSLPEEKIKVFCEACKRDVLRVIGPPGNLRRLFQDLNHKQRLIILQALKTRDASLDNLNTYLSSHSVAQLGALLQDQNECDQMSNAIPTLDALIFILHEQSIETLRILLPAISQARLRLMPNSHSLNFFFMGLSEEKAKFFCEVCKEDLYRIITVNDDVYYTLNNLSSDVRSIVLETMKADLPRLIQSAKQLWGTFRFLTSEQFAHVFHACQAEAGFWFEVIQTALNFTEVWLSLPDERRLIVFDACHTETNFWFRIIKSKDELNWVLQHLKTPEQVLRVINAYLMQIAGVEFHDNISLSDLLTVLNKPLSDDQASIVCYIYHKKLPRMVRSAKDLEDLLQAAGENQRTPVLQALFQELPSLLLESVDVFRAVWTSLRETEHELVFTAIEAHLPRLIKSRLDFSTVLTMVSQARSARVFEVCYDVKDFWPRIITSLDDLSRVLGFLDEHRDSKFVTAVLHAVQGRLPDFIVSVTDLHRILRLFCSFPMASKDVGQQIVITACKTRLLECIRSVADFEIVIDAVLEGQRAFFVNTYLEQLGVSIASMAALQSVLIGFSEEPERVTLVLYLIKDKLPAVIQSPEDFRTILSRLTQPQADIVYNAYKGVVLQVDKICRALCAGETSLSAFFGIGQFDVDQPHESSSAFVTRFFSQIESSPQGRLARAYRLYCENQRDTSRCRNLSLLRAAHRDAFAHSAFFARSRVAETSSDHYFCNASPGSRRAKMGDVLYWGAWP